MRKISFYQYHFLSAQVDTQMGNGKESSCQCRRCRFEPRVWNIPLEEEMANYSNILAWEIPQTRSLADYSPGSHKESNKTQKLNQQQLSMYVCV